MNASPNVSPLSLCAALAAAILAAGCGGGSVTVGAPASLAAPDGGGGSVQDGGSGGRHVEGTVTYDAVPALYDPVARTGTLDFAHAVAKPVRNATVEVLQEGEALGRTATGEDGRYALGFTPGTTGSILVRVLAETASPSIRVGDNTQGGKLWALEAALAPGATRIDLHATHGWAGGSFDAARRSAAPFAVLDALYTAARAFMAVRPVELPPLVAGWSPANAPQEGDPAAGGIGSTHWAPTSGVLHVLGKDGVNTDEFDSQVVVSAWAHWYEATLSRSDSPGGPHAAGAILDPRVAFSEGLCKAIAALVLPGTTYADTAWISPGGALSAKGFDAADASPSDDPNPGPFSELSVARLLYRLVDAGHPQPFDTVGVGLGTLHDVLTGPHRTTSALTTLASFIAGLKAQPGVPAGAVDALLAHGGVGPITTELGDGDANLRGMYQDVTVLPAQAEVTLVADAPWNGFDQNQYFVGTGNGAVMTTAVTAPNVGLVLYQAGTRVAEAPPSSSGAWCATGPWQARATWSRSPATRPRAARATR